MRAEVRDAERSDWSYRSVSVAPSSLNEAARTVDVQLTTEAAVRTWDNERYEVVPEVLLRSGAVLPAKGQMPLLDDHGPMKGRVGTGVHLGSIRNLHVNDEGVAGTAHFSTVAEDQWTKVKEGHIDELSGGYRVLEKTYVPKGATATIQGRNFTGPVNVATKWLLKEGSITPFGADAGAGFRSDRHASRQAKEPKPMNPELILHYRSLGMPATIVDSDEAAILAWVKTDTARKPEQPAAQRSEPPATINMDDFVRKAGEVAAAAASKAISDHQAKITGFRSEVDGLCDLASVPTSARSDLYGLADIASVREKLLQIRAEREANLPIGGSQHIEFGAAQRDKMYEGIRSAVLLRAMNDAGANETRGLEIFPLAQRSEHAAVFRHKRLSDLAHECLRADGFDTRGLTLEQICIASLGFPGQAGISTRAAFDPAYHTTGSFAKITQDAINKSMMVGYTEVAPTWRIMFRQGESVADFKTIHRLRMGAVPNMPEWADNKDPEEVSLIDAEETYKVSAKSLKISFSYRLLVNDDMSMLSRVPAQFGMAAARTVNTAAWSPFISNPLMGDGVALFSAATGARKRSNLTTGAAPPSNVNLQTLRSNMRLMRGENTPEGNESDDILNLEPKFIWGPSSLELTILQLCNSQADPALANAATWNAARTLTPVIEPLLDAASETAWGICCSPTQCDTVEVTFLQGHETPITRNWADPERLCQNYVVLQAFAAKALNHRGVQKATNA